jgi:chloramphenicol-sensitive protein RarD
VLIALRTGWRSVQAVFLDARLVAALTLSATLIAVNWGVFIWAVADGRVLESSLGYFINPLVNVLLGVVVLGERLRRVQWLAVLLAALGVLHQLIALGTMPWVALTLALSFGGYGLVRKTASVDAITGLFVEALLLAPVALLYLVHAGLAGEGAFGRHGPAFDLLLVFAGPLTALPLILFVAGARRIRLTTVGLLQYIAPTGHFLLAVLVYGEAFSRQSFITFALIWTALVVYTLDAVQATRPR